MIFPFYVGRENVFVDGGHAVTDPSALTGFPASRLRDRLDYEGWRPDGTNIFEFYTVDAGVGNTIEADFVAIIGHNMGTWGGLWTIQSSPDLISWNPTPMVPVDPIDDRDVFLVSPVLLRDRAWRLVFADCTVGSLMISEIVLGRRVLLPDGADMRIVPHPDDQAITPDRSDQTGDILRVEKRQGVRRHRLNIRNVSAPTYELELANVGFWWWYRNVAAAGLPFVASSTYYLGTYAFPDSVFYGRLEDHAAPMMDNRARGMRELSLDLVGRVT